MAATISARKAGSWLRASARMRDLVGHDVGGQRRLGSRRRCWCRCGPPCWIAPCQPCLTRSAMARRGDGDGADPLLRARRRRGWPVLRFDFQPIAAGGPDRQFFGRPAVEVEGQLRFAQAAAARRAGRRTGRLLPGWPRGTSAADGASGFPESSAPCSAATATPARSSAPKPVCLSAETIVFPLRTGLAPTQIGTVSMWAISNRRGALERAGELQNQVAAIARPAACGDGHCPNWIASAAAPAARSFLRT